MTIVITDKCCPDDWMDEVPPETAKHPSQFLQLRDGKIWLVPLDEAKAFLAGELTAENSHFIRSVEVGDMIGFTFTDQSIPSVAFDVAEDGAITFHGSWPEHANYFGDGYEGIIAETAEEGARELLELDGNAHEIDVWYWSPEVLYRVYLGAAEQPFFERAETVQ